MKKLVMSLTVAVVLALAFTIVASAASDNVYVKQADGLYDIDFDLGTSADGTMYGMVVIEAEETPATFELTLDNIRYIDQGTSQDNILSFKNVGPMALKNNGTYYVYIGGGSYTAAERIGTLSVTGTTPEPPTPVVPTAVTLNQTTATLEIGGTVTLIETVTPGDAEYTAVWTSSAPAVAEVADGVVTAKSEGTATITVTVATGVTATCEVTVEAEEVEEPGETTILYGDVDNSGTVNRLDATFLARNLAKWTVFNNTDYSVLPNAAAADVDASGAVNRLDGTSLARHIAKWTVFNGKDYSKLPIQNAAQ